MVIIGLMPMTTNAQNDDFGVWTHVGVKKKLAKEWNISLEGEFRTRDGVADVERWAGTIQTDYRLFSWLKANLGYTYIHQSQEPSTTRKGNLIPTYWYSRHRIAFSLTGSVDWNRLTFSLRERWQYTYRPETSVAKFDEDGITPKEDEIVKGKGRNVLRSRLQLEYNLRKSPFTPYASCELYHDGSGLDKSRWTIGSEYKINKKNVLDVYYRFQNRTSEEERDNHVLGIGYTYKF